MEITECISCSRIAGFVLTPAKRSLLTFAGSNGGETTFSDTTRCIPRLRSFCKPYSGARRDRRSPNPFRRMRVRRRNRIRLRSSFGERFPELASWDFEIVASMSIPRWCKSQASVFPNGHSGRLPMIGLEVFSRSRPRLSVGRGRGRRSDLRNKTLSRTTVCLAAR